MQRLGETSSWRGKTVSIRYDGAPEMIPFYSTVLTVLTIFHLQVTLTHSASHLPFLPSSAPGWVPGDGWICKNTRARSWCKRVAWQSSVSMWPTQLPRPWRLQRDSVSGGTHTHKYICARAMLFIFVHLIEKGAVCLECIIWCRSSVQHTLYFFLYIWQIFELNLEKSDQRIKQMRPSIQWQLYSFKHSLWAHLVQYLMRIEVQFSVVF